MRSDQDGNRERVLSLILCRLESAREPILVLDARLQVTAANPAFYRVFDVATDETEGRLIYELGDGQWNIPKLRELLEEMRRVAPAHRERLVNGLKAIAAAFPKNPRSAMRKAKG